MLKFVEVYFPLTADSPYKISQFNWDQRRYEHDMGKIRFADWNPDPVVLSSGSPVRIIVKYGDVSKTHYGYIHHVVHTRTSDSSYVDVYVIGASYVMKQPVQKVYSNTTASNVVSQIAVNNRFSYDVAPHDRMFPQIASPGYTQWQLMADLAKKVGYTLRSEGTSLFFKPLTEDYLKMLDEAPSFIAVKPGNPIPPSLYSIKPIVGESVDYGDAMKGAVAVTGYDPKSNTRFSVINDSQADSLRARVNPDLFDRFDVTTSATTVTAAKYEVQAAQELNRFPYRAFAVLVGTPTLRPDMPIIISGVNSDLDGYWIVLEANHIVEDGMYTTEVVIGLDSLGSTLKKTPPGPASKVVVPPPTLKVSHAPVLPAKTLKFSKVANRLSDAAASSVSAMWQGSAADLRNDYLATAKASQVISR